MFNKYLTLSANDFFDKFIWSLVFFTFLFCLSLPGGYNFPLALLLILAIYQIASDFIFKRNVNKAQLYRDDYLLIIVFFLFFISAFISFLIDGMHLRVLDKPSRFLLAIPIFYLLVNKRQYKDFIWYGVVGGAILAFFLALYERFILLMPRAEGFNHPIMFGNIALLLGVLSLVSAFYFSYKKNKLLVYFSIVATFSGVFTSLLSGSRSGWLAIPIIFLFLLWFTKSLVLTKLRYGVAILFLAFIGVTLSFPSIGVTNRINQGITNFNAYFEGVTNTSVGLRLDMWKGAYLMFIESPFIGVGLYGSEVVKDKLVNSGAVSKESTEFTHAHNEFLNTLSLQGLFGFLFLIMIYLIPLKLFMGIMNNSKNTYSTRFFAMAGATIPICYMSFALTQSMFSHNMGVMVYALFIVFFWVASRRTIT